MSPRAPKPAAPWRRGSAGSYRSADERFEVLSEGPGRWFVRDAAERDELGLERTIGPFPTLEAAKADAAARRDRAPDTSSLTARLASRGEPRRRTAPRSPSSSAPSPRPPASPTWLDRLASGRPADARRARGWIAALERLGVGDAEAIVRRDLEADQPAVAEALLERSVRRAFERALDSVAADRAIDAGPGHPTEPAGADRRTAAAGLLAVEAARAVLEEISLRERAADADPSLPGWRLVERDPAGPAGGRRLRPDPDAAVPRIPGRSLDHPDPA